MKSFTNAALALASFASLASGAALPQTNASPVIAATLAGEDGSSTVPPITAEQIIAFAPSSAACNASAAFADECRTAEQAVPFINAAFQQYDICTVGEQAAVLSLMTFETGNFSFNTNHFPAPGNPGQGTRNMMNFPFIMQYAQNITSTAAQANALAPDPLNASNDTKNAVRALVLGDDLSFATGAWFLKESGLPGCGEETINGLKAATEAGWETYITKCVGTTVTDDRKSVYLAALAALQ